jgi:hypothetical protein
MEIPHAFGFSGVQEWTIPEEETALVSGKSA